MSNCPTLEVTESSRSESTELTAQRRNPSGPAGKFVEHLVATLSPASPIAVPLVGSVWLLIVCKTIIGSVSAFDTYLTLKYARSLNMLEQNPIGRWLMNLDHGPPSDTAQIAAFITAKFMGTMFVLIAIQGLAYWRVRIATVVAMCVAMGQVFLAWYLLYGPA